MKARVRRWSGVVFRPVAIAFDPRLEGLEHRIVERVLARLDAVERHVATDADTAAEMTVTQSRLLARLDARLAALEAGSGGAVPAALLSSHPVAVAWVMGALAGLEAPGRLAVAAPGDPGLPLALVGLGHTVLVADTVTLPEHPRLRRDEGDGSLDAAVVLCGEGPDGPLPVPVEVVAGLAQRLRAGGTLLVSTPQRATDDVEAPLGGLRLVERMVVVPTPGGPWEVARDGSAGDGVALLRAVAER
ncbi:MAG TPA: hypothetical protein VN193_10995 [Candidatus Angelobacter sp.]|nr:hypothetical protein [Candidatus Angelobacter sp.]